MRRSRVSGMSLVEIMIVMAILIIVVGAVYLIIFRSTRQFTDGSKTSTVVESARLALDKLANEIRQANKNAVVEGTSSADTTSKSIEFYMLTGFASSAPTFDSNSTKYQVMASPVDANHNNNSSDDFKLVRIYGGGNPVTITHYVKTGGFTYTRSGDTYQITLTLHVADDQNVIQERVLKTSVTVRNEP
jgi:type II secretory pathway pseudopilin PulG